MPHSGRVRGGEGVEGNGGQAWETMDGHVDEDVSQWMSMLSHGDRTMKKKGKVEGKGDEETAKGEAQATSPVEVQHKVLTSKEKPFHSAQETTRAKAARAAWGPTANFSPGTQALGGLSGVTPTELGNAWVSLGSSCSFHLW